MPLKNILDRLRDWSQRRFGVAAFEQVRPELGEWLKSDYGKQLLDSERALLDPALADLFGYHLLEMSPSEGENLSRASRIHHRFTLSPNTLDQAHARGPSFLSGAQADLDVLPLESESIDVVVLHHVLEFSQRPHQLLREVSRVLMPRGHMIIVGFNPNSVFGVVKFFARLLSGRAQWRHHAITRRRVNDWLRLLDFATLDQKSAFYRPPIDNARLLNSLAGLEVLGNKLHLPGGSFYFIVARKEVTVLTPIKPQWQGFMPIKGLRTGKASSSRVPEAVSRQEPVNKSTP